MIAWILTKINQFDKIRIYDHLLKKYFFRSKLDDVQHLNLIKGERINRFITVGSESEEW